VSAHTIIIRVVITDAGTSSLTRNPLNALCRNDMSSVVSFVTEIQYKQVTRVGVVIFILVRADKTELRFMYRALQYCLAFVGNSKMLISFRSFLGSTKTIQVFKDILHSLLI